MKLLIYCFLFYFSVLENIQVPWKINEVPARQKGVQLEIIDLTPKFMKFYDTVVKTGAVGELRFRLWKELYGFAALPPGPLRDEQARNLLEKAWPKYALSLNEMKETGTAIREAAPQLLQRVIKVLNADSLSNNKRIKIILFIGGFESNAFTFVDENNIPTIALPVETHDSLSDLGLVHEFTHAVHSFLCGIPIKYLKPIAQLILTEGLAMRTTETIFPGFSRNDYTNAHSNDWLKQADAHQKEILRGIKPYLEDSSAINYSRFLFGTGSTGLNREAYYVGWIIVGGLLESGMSLASIARLSNPEIQITVKRAIQDILATP